MVGTEYQLLSGGLSLILFGVALLIALRLLRDVQQPGRIDDVSTLLLIGAWVMILIGGMATVGSVLTGRDDEEGVLCLLAAGIIAAAWQVVTVHFRKSRQQMLLWSMATAAERGIPLESATEAFAADCGEVRGTRIRELAKLLRAGWSLPDALGRLPGLVPRQALAAIRVGYESGALAESLREAVDLGPAREKMLGEAAGRMVYLAEVLMFGIVAATFMALKIMPQFRRICADFGLALPALTQATFGAMGMLPPLGVWITWACVFAFFCLLAMHIRGTGWTLIRPRGLLWRLDTAAILDGLAVAVAHQRPLEQGIAALAQAYPRWSVRRNLRKVLREVGAGADPLVCLAGRGLLGQADLAVLQAAQRLGNLGWALREMADSNRRRLVQRIESLLHFLFPLAILALGALVMVFVVSCFLPLVVMIQALV